MVFKRAVAPAGWFPKRGDICLFKLDKERPALVISSDALNRHSLEICVAPISTKEHRSFTLRPALRAGDGGLAYDSWVKCDHVTTIEKDKAVYPPITSVDRSTLEAVGWAVKLALDLP
jgi:mRNA-degrading endonuclease toxin of MazEF toxin-antitoxin module